MDAYMARYRITMSGSRSGRSPPGRSPIPGWYRSGVICLNRSTPRFIHTPSNVFWITVAMLDFPDRGVPFKMLKVNSFCRCCELLVPLHLPQKMALKPSDSLHPLGDGNGSLLSPDNSPPPSYPESQNGGGRDRLPQASSSGF